MAVVTDLQYYLDDNIIHMVDLAINRQKKSWDNLWIYDGDEGSGKTSMAIAHCHYISSITGAKFTTDNIFFDLDKLMDFAAKNEKQIILWDEAALGALSTQWSNKAQNKLVTALMTARKKNHFWIFCIPKFYELRRYVVRRAMGLIHIYSPDGLARGYFTYYKKDQKNWLYNKVKKTNEESWYKQFSFRGKFINYQNKPLIDWDNYEQKKDQAILDMFATDQQVNLWKEKLMVERNTTASNLLKEGFTQNKIGEIMGISRRSVFRALKIPENNNEQGLMGEGEEQNKQLMGQ